MKGYFFETSFQLVAPDKVKVDKDIVIKRVLEAVDRIAQEVNCEVSQINIKNFVDTWMRGYNPKTGER